MSLERIKIVLRQAVFIKRDLSCSSSRALALSLKGHRYDWPKLVAEARTRGEVASALDIASLLQSLFGETHLWGGRSTIRFLKRDTEVETCEVLARILRTEDPRLDYAASCDMAAKLLGFGSFIEVSSGVNVQPRGDTYFQPSRL